MFFKINKINYNLNNLSLYIIIFLTLLLILTGGGGADSGSYITWTEYFSKLDLNIFNHYPKSINGTPLSAWQYGVGLLSFFINKILFIDFFLEKLFILEKHSSIRVTLISSLLCLINITLLVILTKKYIKDYFNILVIFSSLLLLTTVGFYINRFSTESWSIFLILISLNLIEYNKTKFFDFKYLIASSISIINYFLILVKGVNVFIAFSLFLIYLTTIPVVIFKNSKKVIIKIFLLFFIFPFISILLLAIYHYIINGNIFLSPYNVNDLNFSSLDFNNLKILEVLFSPLHGIIFYHPFLLLYFIYLLYVLIRDKNFFNKYKIINFSVFLSFSFQLVVQSAYFIWWEGTGTFGARTFTGVSILLFYSFLINKKKIFFFLKKKKLFFLIIFLICYQSYILALGESSFKDLSSFFSIKNDLYDRSFKEIKNIKFLFFGIFISLFLSVIFNYFLHNKIKNTLLIKWSLIFLLLNSLIFFLFNIYEYRPFFLILIFIFSFLIKNSFNNVIKITSAISKVFYYRIFFIFFIFYFLISIFYQIILFSQLLKISNNNYLGGRSFSCEDHVSSYNEYLRIPGYEDQKNIYLDFLIRQKCIAN
jgi:hypothetical protein